MRTFVFAIGGTGARVLRSLSMLLAGGADGTNIGDEIVPIIIDYDRENGDTDRAQEALDCYEHIHNLCYSKDEEGISGKFFCAPVYKLKDLFGGAGGFEEQSRFEIYLKDEDTDKTYADHIGFTTLGDAGNTSPTRHLLEALYDNSDEKDPKTELHMNLKKGFKGCPNIGSVVTKSLENSIEIQRFFGLIGPEDRIVIIGSIFGGTGASGIPTLLDMIQSRGNLDNNLVAVVAITPYFKVDKDGSSAINSDTFTAKTKAALDAYELGSSVNVQANAIYYVGDKYQPGTFKNEEGGKEQKNDAHVVELVAAMDVIDFINRDRNTAFPDIHSGRRIPATAFEFGFDDLTPAEIKAGVDPNLLGFKRFYKTETFDPYLLPLCRLAIFDKFCRNFLLDPSNIQDRDAWAITSKLKDNKELLKYLKKFCDMFEGWTGELQQSERKRGVAFFNFTKNYGDLMQGIKAWKPRATVGNHDFGRVELITDDKIRTKLGTYDKLTAAGVDHKAETSGKPFMKAIDEVIRILMKESVLSLPKNPY